MLAYITIVSASLTTGVLQINAFPPFLSISSTIVSPNILSKQYTYKEDNIFQGSIYS